MKFYFDERLDCTLPAACDAAWAAECVIAPALFGMVRPTVRTEGENVITLGVCEAPALTEGEAVILTTPTGIAIRGRDYGATMRGLMTVLLSVEIERPAGLLYRPCGTEVLCPHVALRGVHLCAFPETTKKELQTLVRLAGLLRFSHLIVEFWGTLDFEIAGVPLAWPGSMTLGEVRALFDEARAWGMEIIPMFNHLGHAAGSRIRSGKHVVLDQAPQLAPLFLAHGWEWDITNEKVYAILSEIRRKLIGVAGEGSYFHFGCDEAYSFGYGENRAAALADFLKRILDEPEMKGRRGIIWGDMLQLRQNYANEPQRYAFNVTDPAISETLAARLDRRLIVADWQYGQTGACWKSAEAFSQMGFDVLCCPWDHDERGNVRSALQTVQALGLCGMLHTTWHTIDDGIPLFVYAGLASYTGDLSSVDNYTRLRLFSAETLRKVQPYAAYRDAGFHREQLHLQ